MTADTKKEPVGSTRMKHDEFVRFYLSEKETAISFLETYLPRAITQHMDFKSLTMPKESFLNKKMARYYSDILFQVQMREVPAFIYFLVEHKRKKDGWVGFQLLKYFVRIWELYLKQNKGVKKLPLILPLVIYHGESEWKMDTQFISLLDVPENLLEFVRPYVPNFRFDLLDISHMPDEKIKGEVLSRIMLLTLKYIFRPDFEEKMDKIFGLFDTYVKADRGIEYLEVWIHYLFHQLPTYWAEKMEQAIPQLKVKGGDVMITIADDLIAKGKALGKAEERERTTWEIIKNAFNMDLPINVIEKLTGLNSEQINRLKEKMA